MSDKIMSVKSVRIPLMVYGKIEDCLYQNHKINAIKVLRNSEANVEDEFVGDARSSTVLGLKQCKQVVDWIQSNPGLVFTNDRWALVPASILTL